MKSPSESNPKYDVLISGAGPVGLFLASELALRKCSVLVLEKAESPGSPLKRLPFGVRGLNAPSIEALDRRGMLSGLDLHKRLKNPHQPSGQGARRQLGHFAGIPFLEGDVDPAQWPCRLPGSPEPSLMTEMEELEIALTNRAEALGVVIRRGQGATGLEQDAEGVTVRAGNDVFQARWVVGCDGSRSVVRKAGGFEFAGTEPEFTGYTVQADLADPEKLKPGRNLTARGMYMQSQPGYLMIQDFDSGTFHDSGRPITPETVQAVLSRISETDVTIRTLHAATTWTDRARQATGYRKGRVLLAGDAAHIHSPLGGQGLNLGLGDAMNLGWKLAATIQGTAPEGLLDTYADERQPVGMQVLEWSRAQVTLMKPDPGARALNAVMRDLMATRDGATYFAGRVWGVNLKYDLGGTHPLVGRSTPNFEWADGTTLSERLNVGMGLLLDFNGDEALEVLASRYKDQLVYAAGPVKEPLGLSAVLVRPDGIVAWAADDGHDPVEAEQTAARWFRAERAV